MSLENKEIIRKLREFSSMLELICTVVNITISDTYSTEYIKSVLSMMWHQIRNIQLELKISVGKSHPSFNYEKSNQRQHFAAETLLCARVAPIAPCHPLSARTHAKTNMRLPMLSAFASARTARPPSRVHVPCAWANQNKSNQIISSLGPGPWRGCWDGLRAS